MRHQERRGSGQGRRMVTCIRIKTLAEKFELHLGMMAPRTEEDRLMGSGDQRRAPSQRGGRERGGEINCPQPSAERREGIRRRKKTQSPERPPQSHPASLFGSSYTHKRKANGHQSRTRSQVASTEKTCGPGGSCRGGPQLARRRRQDPRAQTLSQKSAKHKRLKPPGLLRARASL